MIFAKNGPFCHKCVTAQVRKALILLGLRAFLCHRVVTVGVDFGECDKIFMQEMRISIQCGFDVGMAHDNL